MIPGKKDISCYEALCLLLIFLLHSLPLVLEKKIVFIIFYYVHYAMVMSKRNKIPFQLNVHDAMIMIKIGYIRFRKKNTLIATMSTRL